MRTSEASHRKERERFLVESFIRLANLPAVVSEDREAPDFILRFEDQLVGLEVTELFISTSSGGESLQARESISSQIAAKAQNLYRAAGGKPAHVSVCFCPSMSLREINRDRTAQALCNFLLQLNLEVSERRVWCPDDMDEQLSELPEEISFVQALGVPSYDMAHWAVARAGWVAPLNVAPLQQRITEKAKRIESYRNAVNTNWLLIVADAMKPSSFIEIKSDFAEEGLQSPFDRTFFYRHPDGFVELCLTKLTPNNSVES